MSDTLKIVIDDVRNASNYYADVKSDIDDQSSLTANGFDDSNTWAQNVCNHFGNKNSELSTAVNNMSTALSDTATKMDETDSVEAGKFLEIARETKSS